MAGDPEVYALGLPDVELQNRREFNEHPREQNIPKTHRNHRLGHLCPMLDWEITMNSDAILRPVAVMVQRFPEHFAARRGIQAK
jgi:hypothetical protein